MNNYLDLLPKELLYIIFQYNKTITPIQGVTHYTLKICDDYIDDILSGYIIPFEEISTNTKLNYHYNYHFLSTGTVGYTECTTFQKLIVNPCYHPHNIKISFSLRNIFEMTKLGDCREKLAIKEVPDLDKIENIYFLFNHVTSTPQHSGSIEILLFKHDDKYYYVKIQHGYSGNMGLTNEVDIKISNSWREIFNHDNIVKEAMLHRYLAS